MPGGSLHDHPLMLISWKEMQIQKNQRWHGVSL